MSDLFPRKTAAKSASSSNKSAESDSVADRHGPKLNIIKEILTQVGIVYKQGD